MGRSPSVLVAAGPGQRRREAFVEPLDWDVEDSLEGLGEPADPLQQEAALVVHAADVAAADVRADQVHAARARLGCPAWPLGTDAAQNWSDARPLGR